MATNFKYSSTVEMLFNPPAKLV